LVGVNRICKLTGISKATYYASKHPDERFLAKYAQIKAYVEKVIGKNSAYGIRRIKAALLEDYGVTVGRDTLARLLRLWGLSLKRKIRRSRPSLIQKILISLADRTNLLIRSNITKPLQAITSDISELIYQNGKCYLCVHKDVFGQMVYGFSIKQTMEVKLVIESWKQALNKIRTFSKHISKQLLVHQDQGSQYTGYDYVEEVLKHATLSYSTPGTPTENPGQESFFGRFKQEWADEIKELGTFKQVQKFVAKKIKYYNCQRLHTSTGLMSPSKFTKLSLSTGS
jgi:putative transposase